MKSAPTTTPSSGETGWLPDCVYTGEKFETGLAFFADDRGRITRFSREPADLEAARPLKGQAAVPGLVNGHSQALHRLLRGRTEPRQRNERDSLQAWQDAWRHATDRLTPEDVYDASRMAFVEMLLSGITCVGEFHTVHRRAEGSSWAEPNQLSHEVLRAARDTGIRIAFLRVAVAHSATGGDDESLPPHTCTPDPDQFIREMDALRQHVAREHPGDEIWLGVGVHSLRAAPLDFLKTIATHAHAQRFRLHIPVSVRPSDNEACVAAHGRRPVEHLAAHGLIDKRFTAVHAIHISEEEARLLGAARAMVCCCPTSERNRGDGVAPADKLLAAGAALALGTDSQVQINLLEDARRLEYQLRVDHHEQAALRHAVATTLLHAATVAGARSLGAPSGALEVGRPADFFTVNLYDPSIAGADANALLNHIVFSLERRAIREVWIGGRRQVASGHHPQQGPIISRFVDLQRRVWGAP